MIRLEIYPVGSSTPLVPHLPATLSFEMIRENPLFNRRGDYTYDIDISLRDPHNRAIYNHIDRLTATFRPQNRRARLICDGRVIADGTEVILSKENDYAKIQIVAGNSELNYITADENLKIRDMNFGTIATPENWQDHARAISPLIYPATNYTFPMIAKGSTTLEGFDNKYHFGAWRGSNEHGIYYDDNTDFWPQPFVLYYVRKFIELLGYEITRNDLESDDRWVRLVLISGYRSLEYAKMLPNWTAAEFITEIERFFNCVILTEPGTKTAQIIMLPEYYSVAHTETIGDDELLDDFNREYDITGEAWAYANDNLKYKLPGENVWKYKNLPEDVRTASKRITMGVESARAETDNDYQIYRDTSLDEDFVFTKDRDNEGNVTRKRWWIVDEYHHEATGQTDWKEMRIIPANTFVGFFKPADIYYNPPMLVGIVSAFPEFYDNSAVDDFTKKIIEGTSESASDSMQVAFYTGIIEAPKADTETGELSASSFYYAMLQTTPICVTRSGKATNSSISFYQGNQQVFHLNASLWPLYYAMTLNLDKPYYGRYAKDFNKNRLADFTEKYTFQLRTGRGISPTDFFLIHGRLFICQQLKYTYADGRQHPIVEGTFYPYI